MDRVEAKAPAPGRALACAVVMPAWNERDCIGKVLGEWVDALRTWGGTFKLIVVDDGSTDGTGAVLDTLAGLIPELVVQHRPNGGHGAAVTYGYRIAVDLAPEHVFQVDSDDQFEPTDFARLWALRNDSAFILGYRSERQDPLHRLVITRILRLVLAVVFGVWIRDSNIPFRLIRGPYLKRLLEVLPGGVFTPNIFLSVLAARDGQDLRSVPVIHRDRQTGKSSIVKWKLIKVCLRSLRELVAFRVGLNRALAALRSHG